MTDDFSSQIICNAMWTPDGTFLHSKHRHDYVTHLDRVTGELYLVDGGNDYIRCSVNTVDASPLVVTMKDKHTTRRLVFAWKTYGKDGEFPEGKWLYLNEMTTEHISAILATHEQIKGTYVEQLFRDELKFREEYDV